MFTSVSRPFPHHSFGAGRHVVSLWRKSRHALFYRFGLVGSDSRRRSARHSQSVRSFSIVECVDVCPFAFRHERRVRRRFLGQNARHRRSIGRQRSRPDLLQFAPNPSRTAVGSVGFLPFVQHFLREKHGFDLQSSSSREKLPRWKSEDFLSFLQVVFRKIADVQRERELAETRRNEGLDQLGTDHPVRRLITKFRKISQENRMASQTSSAVSPPTLPAVEPAEPVEPAETSLLVPPGKPRDKLETISERIETQQSNVSQITSVHQSPPLQRPPKSSKWKWLKTGSTGPEVDSPPATTKTSTNPFDSNLNEEEKRASIPLSLFVPRGAKSESNEENPSLDESHSDINLAFAPRRSVSTHSPDQHLLASLIEMKKDLGGEVRALNTRMGKIDEQISQILRVLLPSTVVTNPFAADFPDNVESSSSTASERPRKAPTIFSRSKRLSSEENENELTALSIPPPPSVYNRSAFARTGNASNRIAPAPTVIDLETNVATKRSGKPIFRRFIASNPRPVGPTSTLLYPPTSDDERPPTPASSGNDDDDDRPLTSASKSHSHHHHTLL